MSAPLLTGFTPLKVEIIEILGRAAQGVTRPFRCRGADDHYYFVKGRSAGTRSHTCEWMAGQLAMAFGLQLPPFGEAFASSALVQTHPEGRDLGIAPAFASREVPNLAELTWSTASDVPQALRRDVLMLDWWLLNNDRTLTAFGGNPNLLWDAEKKQLVTIDYNLAFDRQFDMELFKSLHVFRDEIPAIQRDFYAREEYSARFTSALSRWDAIGHTLPLDWLYHDVEQGIPTDFDMNAHRQQLERFTQDDFWSFA